ncbi:CDGSH iron-sulfur domain-containing protein [Mycobacterium sp. E136]|uniref:CDGSH iron-sulfur domain-containing protein n=1 Tax=Mycobacterium sp. E136 TaxID=1834125 RepID=UPI000B1ACC1D|nr:CDGSH iron-sulfur domain-containing protein [Mycobacterium sp. E136]
MSDSEPRTVRVVPNGPLMVQGPVRIEMPDGQMVESDRFMVAVCTCRRSKDYPLCDTSHRCRKRADAPAKQNASAAKTSSAQRPA